MNLRDEIERQKAVKELKAQGQSVAKPTTPAPITKPNPLAGILNKGKQNVEDKPAGRIETNETTASPTVAASNTVNTPQPAGIAETGQKAPKPGILGILGKNNGAKPAATSNGQTGTIQGNPAPPPGNVPRPPEPKPPVEITPKVGDAVVIPDNIPQEQRLQIEELQRNIKYLIENIDEKDLIKDVVRNILAKLQANPDLCVFVPNLTMNQIVRGCRAAYKFEARKAGEKREVKVKKSEKQSAIMKDFSDLNFKL